MKVHLEITYNTRIRLLDEEVIECQLKETNNNNIASYYCETEIKNSNIKQIKIKFFKYVFSDSHKYEIISLLFVSFQQENINLETV